MRFLESAIRRAIVNNGMTRINDEHQMVDVIINSSKHLVDSYIYEYIDVSNGISKNLDRAHQLWKESIIRKTIDCNVKFYIIHDIIRTFEENKMDYIFLKGPIIQDIYPSKVHRYMGDFDILVRESNIQKAIQSLESIGYKRLKTDINDYDIKLIHDKGMMIELHFNLSTKDIHPNVDLFRDDILDEKVVYDLEGIRLFGPDVDHHLVYLFLHASNHLFFDSVGLRAFLDIALYVKRYKKDIHWEFVEKKLKLLNIYQISCYFLMYIKKNIYNEIHTYNLSIDEIVYEELEKVIRYAGMFKNPEDKYYFDYVYKKYISEGRDIENRRIRAIKVLFPSSSKLKDKYNYAKKSPILLPIAWAHRIIFELIYDKNRAFKFLLSKPNEENIKRQAKILHFFGLERK